ncbi:MAG: ThuA domain-containing protein [Balneolales bacterium]
MNINKRLLVLTVLTVTLASCGLKTAETDPTIKALLITGGGWHDYETQETLLTEGLSERLDIEWTIMHEGNKEPDYLIPELQEDDWADGYDVVVHNTGYGRVMDVEYINHLVESHKGTPAVLIHASVHSYRYAEPADSWFEFMGLQSMKHESRREFEVENIAGDHPIMKDYPNKWNTPVDEIYINEKIWGDITPLARAYGQDTEKYHTITWTHEYEGTRIFSTTLGHENEMFREKLFLDNVANGLLWAVERLDTAEKTISSK